MNNEDFIVHGSVVKNDEKRDRVETDVYKYYENLCRVRPLFIFFEKKQHYSSFKTLLEFLLFKNHCISILNPLEKVNFVICPFLNHLFSL